MDATTTVALFTFLGVLVQAGFSAWGADRARKHELEKMRMERELKEEDE